MCASAMNGVPLLVERFLGPPFIRLCKATANVFGLFTMPSWGGRVGLVITDYLLKHNIK
jgi:hypothetical protein